MGSPGAARRRRSRIPSEDQLESDDTLMNFLAAGGGQEKVHASLGNLGKQKIFFLDYFNWYLNIKNESYIFVIYSHLYFNKYFKELIFDNNES